MASLTRFKNVAWRDRAPKEKPEARCCWVCGKVGGYGFTTALRLAGYRNTQGQIGYAHNACMVRANREHQEHMRDAHQLP